jgi:hypothetical protein
MILQACHRNNNALCITNPQQSALRKGKGACGTQKQGTGRKVLRNAAANGRGSSSTRLCSARRLRGAQHKVKKG